MRVALAIIKWLLFTLVLVVVALAGWLWFAPPELIRVGSNYAAKIVCSNVYLAERPAEEVLSQDVQAPGHPLLKLMRVRVDPQEATVRAGLLGWFGQGLAVFRSGTGCAAAPDGNLAAVQDTVLNAPERSARPLHMDSKSLLGPLPLTSPLKGEGDNGGLLSSPLRGGTEGGASGEAGNKVPYAMALPQSGNGTAPLWPEGNRIDISVYPEIASILEDPALAGPGMRAILVVRDGRIIGERFGRGVDDHEQPLLGWSMSKVVNAAIVGTVVGAGRLSVEDGDLFPEWPGDSRSEITIAQLLGMESGLTFREDYDGVADVTRMLYLEPDMARFAANMPLLHPAGQHFAYSSGSSVLAARAWQNAFEEVEAALEWPRKALFDPIGMDTAVFETDARGTFVGSSYVYASARDWARFGQLLLQDGLWEGRQVLPDGWVEWMRTPTEASGGEYGRGLWMHGPRVTTPLGQHQDDGFELPEDAYWLIGHDGQTMTIIPSRQLVVVRMGLTPTILAYKPQALVEAVVKALDAGNG